MSRKKTHEEYVEELKIKNPNIEVVEQYINAKTKIMHHCLIHDVYWEIQPSNVLCGNGCPRCKAERLHNKHARTHEQYIEELAMANPNIIVLEQYIDTHTPILHKCLIDGYEWKAMPYNILYHTGCPKCSGKMKKTHDEYIKEVCSININIEVVGTYIDAKTPILHRCLIDEYEWFAEPTNILCGKGCPKCGGKMKKEHEQYVYEVSLINPDIEVVGRYVNAKTPILHRCKIDNCEWMSIPSNVLKGRGCPQCNESNGEHSVRLWLERNNITYIKEYLFDNCRDKYPLPFDFYLPDYNTAIEFQGRQHYEPVNVFGGKEQFELQIKHDKIKSDYCKQNNIRLLCIKYDEDVDITLTDFLFI